MHFPHRVAVVDTETGGLRASDSIWEVALVTAGPDADEDPTEHVFHVAGFATADADPKALELARFYDRHPQYGDTDPATLYDESTVARRVAHLTAGRVLIGVNVSFDVHHLTDLLDRNGYAPRWHYTPLDVAAYAVGALGLHPGPYRSADLADRLGVTRDMAAAHTALADCRYALDLLAAAHAHAAARAEGVRA